MFSYPNEIIYGIKNMYMIVYRALYTNNVLNESFHDYSTRVSVIAYRHGLQKALVEEILHNYKIHEDGRLYYWVRDSLQWAKIPVLDEITGLIEEASKTGSEREGYEYLKNVKKVYWDSMRPHLKEALERARH